MNWWWLYPLIGLLIWLGLNAVDVVDITNRLSLALLIFLWPLAVPFLIWHGITVIRWKRAHGSGAQQPPRDA